MSRRKLERLVNLTLALMATPRPLTAEEIGRLVHGYDADSAEAFRRMFERDKDELRELGIPLETESATVWGDDLGYRIARRDYALPEITLEPDEAAALGLAARLWSSARLSAAGGSALLKLQAAGAPPLEPPSGLEPRVDATEPAFEPVLTAVRAGQPIRFPYRTAGGGEPAVRTLEPWGVVSWRGRWYVAGFDLDRQAPRVFRLSRFVGDVRAAGKPGSITTPAGVDIRALVTDFDDEHGERRTATLRVREGSAQGLRRFAVAVGAHRSEDGWDELTVPFTDAWRLAEQVAAYGPDVVIVEPLDARAAVIRLLQAAVSSPGRDIVSTRPGRDIVSTVPAGTS